VCTGELPPASRTAQLAREHGIGLGEASTLALAETRRARLVLMDDRKARGVTLANGFAVAGTVGVLERAFEQGFLADLREVYVKLRSGTGWIAPDILNESLERHSLTRIG
jgi:predicted nucleic acid-binding protein